MTKLLDEAFQRASALPESMQDLLAQEVLDEIVWEMKWDNELNDSAPFLKDMAHQALRDFENGKTESKGFDEL